MRNRPAATQLVPPAGAMRDDVAHGEHIMQQLQLHCDTVKYACSAAHQISLRAMMWRMVVYSSWHCTSLAASRSRLAWPSRHTCGSQVCSNKAMLHDNWIDVWRPALLKSCAQVHALNEILQAATQYAHQTAEKLHTGSKRSQLMFCTQPVTHKQHRPAPALSR